MHPDDIARIETLDELGMLFSVVQQLSANLEQQTEGYLHHHARELSELLVQARRRFELIQVQSSAMTPRHDEPEVRPSQYRPRAF